MNEFLRTACAKVITKDLPNKESAEPKALKASADPSSEVTWLKLQFTGRDSAPGTMFLCSASSFAGTYYLLRVTGGNRPPIKGGTR